MPPHDKRTLALGGGLHPYISDHSSSLSRYTTFTKMQQQKQHQTNKNVHIQTKTTYPLSSGRAVVGEGIPIYYRKMQHFNDTTYDTGDNVNAAPYEDRYYRHTSPHEDQYYGMTAEQWLLSPRAAMTASVDGQIQEPHFNDVLCGRGGTINSHPGNRVYRGWIARRRSSYNLAECKAEKSRIMAEILQQVRDQSPPGRFLQKVVEKGPVNINIRTAWAEIDDSKALAKISQALREGAPAFKAQHGKEKKRKFVLSSDDPKAPPAMEALPAGTTRHLPESMPPLSPMHSNGRELDVLFPTTDGFFETSRGNGDLLRSYPYYMNEVAVATPVSSPITKKQKTSIPTEAMKFTSPKNGHASTYPNTPLVSPHTPGFSPNGVEHIGVRTPKAAWASFLSDLSPGMDFAATASKLTPGSYSPHHSPHRTARCSYSPTRTKPSLPKVPSLGSFSIGSEDDSNGHRKQDPQPKSDSKAPPRAPRGKVLCMPPPPPPPSEGMSGLPLPPPPLCLAPPHGLSFGRIGDVPESNNDFLVRRAPQRKPTHRGGSCLW